MLGRSTLYKLKEGGNFLLVSIFKCSKLFKCKAQFKVLVETMGVKLSFLNLLDLPLSVCLVILIFYIQYTLHCISSRQTIKLTEHKQKAVSESLLSSGQTE